MAEAYYSLRKSKDGQFYFNLVASNGEPVARSERYTKKDDAKEGTGAVRRAASTTEVQDNT